MNRIFPSLPFAASVPNTAAPARAVLDATFPISLDAPTPTQPIARRMVAAAADWSNPDADPAFLHPFIDFSDATRFALAAQFAALRYIFDAAAPFTHDGTAGGALRVCVRHGLLGAVDPVEFSNRAVAYAVRWSGFASGSDDAVAVADSFRAIRDARTVALAANVEADAEPMGEGMDDDAGDADEGTQDGA